MSKSLRLTAIGLGLVVSSGCASEDASTARVRVAHLSPDAPAIDFCLAPAGSGEFTGPVLARQGGLNGLAYGKLTFYVEVAAMQYDVRLVPPSSTDCARGLGPDYTDLPVLPPGASATIAAVGTIAHGNGAPELGLRAFIDDTEVGAGDAKLRFIHASPGTPAVDVGTGGGVLFAPVFEGVVFGTTAGYLTTAPLDGVELSARATGTTTDVLAIKPASLPAGAIATAFAIGQLDNAAAPLGVLLCLDNKAHGLETECALVGGPPARARVRVAHLSPDAPPVDVCIAPAGGAYPGQPLLAAFGSRAGLAYPQVTSYLDLPAGGYDVRIVLASETTCANPAVPDTTGVELAAGLTATVAALGVLDRSGPAAADPAFRLAVFPDAATVAAGKGKLRFVHASPGTPAVDVGLGQAHAFTRIFANVSFGSVGTSAALDGSGYVEASPFTAAVSARLAGSTTDALVVPSVTLAEGDIATAFAIGNKTGTHVNPLRVLLCADNAPATGLLATCVAAP